MNRAEYNPMFIKRLGGRTGSIGVSSSPSKIPYSGFSPVRLQTGRQRRPSTILIYSAMTPYTPPNLPYLAQVVSRNFTGSFRNRTFAQSALVSFYGKAPVQRPLATQQVMLSCRFISYYDLMRVSRCLCRSYDFERQSFAISYTQQRDIPQFTPHVLSYVPSSVPRRMKWVLSTVFSPTSSAFTFFAQARHPCRHKDRLFVVCVTRLQSSLYATAHRIACPTPAMTFTFELVTHESLHFVVEYYYAGNSQFPLSVFHRLDMLHYGLRTKDTKKIMFNLLNLSALCATSLCTSWFHKVILDESSTTQRVDRPVGSHRPLGESFCAGLFVRISSNKSIFRNEIKRRCRNKML